MYRKSAFPLAVLLIVVMSFILSGCAILTGSAESNQIDSKYRCKASGYLDTTPKEFTLIDILAMGQDVVIGATSISYANKFVNINGLKTRGGISLIIFSWAYIYKGSEKIGFIMLTGSSTVSFYLGKKVCDMALNDTEIKGFFSGVLPDTSGMSNAYYGAGKIKN